MKYAKKNFHLPLPIEVYGELKKVAEQANVSTTQVAREAIESWLQSYRQKSISQGISKFAEQYAGTNLDLDISFERAAIEHLSRKRRKG